MKEPPVEGIDELAGACRHLDAGGPPPHAEAAVKARARAAARRRRAAAWTVPAALAATVLVAFSVVLNVLQDDTVTPAAPEAADRAILRESLPAAAPPVAGPVDRQAHDSAAEKVAPAGAPGVAASRSLAPAMQDESPEAWLARIEALEADGRQAEADAERQRLEAAHPGWLAGQAGRRD